MGVDRRNWCKVLVVFDVFVRFVSFVLSLVVFRGLCVSVLL